MVPKLSEEEIDDLIYLARTGDDSELTGMVQELADREGATRAEIIAAARDDGKATCLHMAAANGHVRDKQPGPIFYPAKLMRVISCMGVDWAML